MMKKDFKVILALALALLMTTTTTANDSKLLKMSNLKKISNSNNEFSLDIFDILNKDNKESSFVFSPLSLRTISAMLHVGAEEETKKELENGMRFPEDNEELYEGYNELLKLIISKGKIILGSANRIYIKEGFQLKPNFINTIKHYFNSKPFQMDFSRGKKSADEINTWVAIRTENKIQNLIEPDTLNNQTRIVVVNALYFKGPWENKFFRRSTKSGVPFYTDQNNHSPVDMMKTEEYFKVQNIPFLDAKAIVLPYEDKKIEMVILRPNERTGLKKLEDNLRNIKYSEITKPLENLRPKNIILRIPKFSLQSNFELVEPMKKLKMMKLFDENEANFKGISESSENLYVSKIVQKAFLDVDENGSEAGAASYASLFTPLTIGPAVEEEVTLDHPFMGFIRDIESDTVLFIFKKAS